MSLWTPGGEVPVNRQREEESAAPQSPGDVMGAPNLDDLSPEERARVEEMVQQMAETQRQIAATPAAQLVANHVVGFYELAALKLQQQPPMFDDAQLAIDAMAAVLDNLEDRLGEDAAPLRQALTNIQMAFVQLKAEAEGAGAG